MSHHVYMAQHGATEQVHTAMQQSQKQTGGEGVEPKPAERAATHPHPYKIFAKRGLRSVQHIESKLPFPFNRVLA